MSVVLDGAILRFVDERAVVTAHDDTISVTELRVRVWWNYCQYLASVMSHTSCGYPSPRKRAGKHEWRL